MRTPSPFLMRAERERERERDDGHAYGDVYVYDFATDAFDVAVAVTFERMPA